MSMTEELLDLEETARWLKISTRSVRRLAREGKLPYCRVGNLYRFNRSDVSRWLQSGGCAAEERELATSKA